MVFAFRARGFRACLSTTGPSYGNDGQLGMRSETFTLAVRLVPTLRLRPITLSGTHFVDTVAKGERRTRVLSKLRFRNGISWRIVRRDAPSC